MHYNLGFGCNEEYIIKMISKGTVVDPKLTNWRDAIDGQKPFYQSNGVEIYKVEIESQLYAVKKVRREIHCGRIPRQMEVCKRLLKQKKDHIVTIFDLLESSNKTEYFILMDYYPYDLSKFLQQQSQLIKENPGIAVEIFLQICYALVNLNRMHRDIKSSNFLIKIEGKKVKVALTDFSECNNGQSLNNSRVGTLFYMAPEIKKRVSQTLYSSKIDVWSLAIILFQIFGIFQLYKEKENHPKLRQFPKQIQKYLQQKVFTDRIQKQFEQFLDQNKPIISELVPFYIRETMRKIINPVQEERPNLYDVLNLLSKFKHQIRTISENCQNHHLVSYKTLQKYRDAQKEKDMQSDKHWRRILLLKKLYWNWYINLHSKITERTMVYSKLAIYMYVGISKITSLYDSLTNKDRATDSSVVICYVFEGEKNNIEQLKAQQFMLQWKVEGFKINKEEAKKMGRQLMQNKKIKQVLNQLFNNEIVCQIQEAYAQIFEQRQSLPMIQ